VELVDAIVEFCSKYSGQGAPHAEAAQFVLKKLSSTSGRQDGDVFVAEVSVPKQILHFSKALFDFLRGKNFECRVSPPHVTIAKKKYESDDTNWVSWPPVFSSISMPPPDRPLVLTPSQVPQILQHRNMLCLRVIKRVCGFTFSHFAFIFGYSRLMTQRTHATTRTT
jgi:hypothetical protein